MCMDGCATAGVISRHTHEIANVVDGWKANLLGAQSKFQSHELPIGIVITAVVSQLDTSKSVCLLEHHEACIYGDVTSLHSNYQMRHSGIVVDDVSTKHKKDKDGNFSTQSLCMCWKSRKAFLRSHSRKTRSHLGKTRIEEKMRIKKK